MKIRFAHALVAVGLATLAGCGAAPEEEKGQSSAAVESSGSEGGGFNLADHWVGSKFGSEMLGRALCERSHAPCADGHWSEHTGYWKEKYTSWATAVANGAPNNTTNPLGTVTLVHTYKFMAPDARDPFFYAGIYPRPSVGPETHFPYQRVTLIAD